jgi:hypothetical protein
MLCDSGATVTVNGLEHRVPCSRCEKCKAARRRDVVGRALAEARYSKHTAVVTLTYGHDRRVDGRVDHPHAHKLVYKDVQDWVKRMRARLIPGTREKYKFRYLVAGEYGKLKGRAHWHVVLFFKSAPPRYEAKQMCVDDEFWPHGHVVWDQANSSSIAYVAKYVTKDEKNPDMQTMYRASLKPLLGGEYLEHWAHIHAEQGLPLNQGRKYQIPGVMSYKTKKKFDYWMTPAGAKHVCRAYIKRWAELYGQREIPLGFTKRKGQRTMLEKYLDEQAKPIVEGYRFDAWRERRERGESVPSGARKLKMPDAPPSGYHHWFDDGVMAFVAVTGDGRSELWWNPATESPRWVPWLVQRNQGLNGIRVSDVVGFEPGQPLRLDRRDRPKARTKLQRRTDAVQRKYHAAMLETAMGHVRSVLNKPGSG